MWHCDGVEVVCNAVEVVQGRVYPGGTPLPYFAAAFPSGGPNTPGNPTLRTTLRLIARPGTTPSPNAGFNDVTLKFTDRYQGLTPAQVLRAARTLRLDIPG